MKILVTGVKGQLGYDVINEIKKRGYNGIGVDIDELDITDKSHTEKLITDINPDAVVHCAAWTAVDLAEDNIEKAREINAYGTENIAKVCAKLNCKMIYLSTDYVFNGQGTNAYKPDDKNIKPLNIYGQTKYEGELAIEKYVEKFFTVRISWVFGVNGKNFIKTMLKLGKENKKINVVSDQIGTPTYTYDLSKLLIDMLETEKYGIYHATNEGGYISWYDFACEIFNQAGKINPVYNDITVNPVSSYEYPSKAIRPLNSRMSKQKLTDNGFNLLPTWQNALNRYLKEIEF